MSIAACRLPGCPWRLTAIRLGADEVAQRFFDAAFDLNQIAFVGHGSPRLAFHPPRALSVKYDAKWKATFPHSLEAIASLPMVGEGDLVFTTDGKRPLGAFSKYKRKLDRRFS